ncbi:MAG: 50S ribosomal protein L21 [Bacteroidota bacterium]|jgi:large subunit ribosomal protein L21|nr:50S ribosomal protein L21 [Bacteroidota bacterium]
MYAIVNISGKQFKVTTAQQIYVPLLESEVGSKVEFADVRLFADDSGVLVGAPAVASAKVTATVLEHMKDEKVLVFHKKRRKGYRKLNGHRQQLTRIEIESIVK